MIVKAEKTKEKGRPRRDGTLPAAFSDADDSLKKALITNKKFVVALAAAFIFMIAVEICVGAYYGGIYNEYKATEPEYRLDRFYYNYLTYPEQLLYNAILSAADKYAERTEILPYSYGDGNFSKVIKYIKADNPRYFFINFGALSLYRSSRRTQVKLSYDYSISDIDVMKEQLDMALRAASLTVTDKISEFAVEKALHDHLAERCSFIVGKQKTDTENTSGGIYNTAYGALVLGKAYSDGYALAFKLLLDENSIYGIAVYGKAGGKAHMWNMAYIDGAFCHVDACWDDADLSFDPKVKFHGYFNISDSRMILDHTPDDISILPTASSDNNYYKVNGLYAASAAEFGEILSSTLIKASGEGRSYVEIYAEQSIPDAVIEETTLAAIIKANQSLDKKYAETFHIYQASGLGGAMTIRFYM